MTTESNQATFDQFEGRPPENSEPEHKLTESVALFRCEKCGIMHDDEDRIDRHIVNEHSRAKHDFTRANAINRYKVEIDR